MAAIEQEVKARGFARLVAQEIVSLDKGRKDELEEPKPRIRLWPRFRSFAFRRKTSGGKRRK
jgi:hypothetical protein